MKIVANLSDLSLDELFVLMRKAARIGNGELLEECREEFKRRGGMDIPITLEIKSVEREA